jgi:hypothetical protein
VRSEINLQNCQKKKKERKKEKKGWKEGGRRERKIERKKGEKNKERKRNFNIKIVLVGGLLKERDSWKYERKQRELICCGPRQM